jgi:PIN domain nuclease of toxin-antitoxin system
MLNLDTHILIFALNNELTRKEREILSSDKWGISSIVLWEITKLHQVGRIEIDLDDVEFRRITAKIQIWPISLNVCRRILELDFKSDPANEIIAATSIEYNVPLVTRDKLILKSKIIPFIR